MKKLIMIVGASLLIASCAGRAVHEVAGLGSETVNTAPTRPYSNLMFPIPVEKLAERADYVLYGNVETVTGLVEKIAPDISLPVSTVTLNIRETLKGDAGGTFTFKSLGARIDDADFFSEEMAHFTAGETVIVFLKAFDGVVLPVGHVQGKISVTNEEEVNELRRDISH
jgi:hypothetical protein